MVPEWEQFVCQTFRLEQGLRPFQREVLAALLENKDVFLSVKTGGGKSLCYHAFPCANLAGKKVDGTKVVIISPLIAIMEEQVKLLQNANLKAAYIGQTEETDKQIEDGQIQFMFASPEMIVGGQRWRDMVGRLAQMIKLVVVDEAHTVLHWGEQCHGNEPFREWFGKIREVMSLLIGCPLLAVTATASTSQRRRIKRKLAMKPNCHEVIENPDRKNIKLSVIQVSSTDPLDVTFLWLLECLKRLREHCPRYVVFCRSVGDCSNLYFMFKRALDDSVLIHCNMYHAKTPDDVKEAIREKMASAESSLRILICTNAAGMGVNFAGVYNVINYGPPREMDTLLQQVGRAGRDDQESHHLLLYSPRQLRKCETEVLEYVRNNNQCRRILLLKAYHSEPDKDRNAHSCCDVCAATCECGLESCSDLVMEGLLGQEMAEEHQDILPLSHEVRDVLKTELMIYRDMIGTNEDVGVMCQDDHVHGFSEDVIDDIVKKCESLATPDDVFTKCSISKYEYALQIAVIINRVVLGYEPDWTENVVSDEYDDI